MTVRVATVHALSKYLWMLLRYFKHGFHVCAFGLRIGHLLDDPLTTSGKIDYPALRRVPAA